MTYDESEKLRKEMHQIEYWIRGLMNHSYFLRRTGARHMLTENEQKIQAYAKRFTTIKAILEEGSILNEPR